MGKVTDFKISLDWVLKTDSIIKILEGNYRTEETISSSPFKLYEDLKKEETPLFWHQIKENLVDVLGRETYIAWITKLKFISFNNNILELKAETAFIRQYVEQHYAIKIKSTALKFLPELKKIKISS